MFFFYLYAVALFIAPQLWVPPFIGLPVDYIIYPLWTLWAVLSGRLFRIRWGAPDLFFLAWVVWVAITMAFNAVGYNIPGMLQLAYGKWFVLYLLVRSSVSTDRDLRRAAAFITAMVYILVAEGISHKNSPDGLNWAGQPLGWVDISVIEAGGSGRTRWLGIFDGIGVFAVAYTTALPFVLQYAFSVFGPKTRWFNLIGLPFFLLALFYTGSRGAFLATLSLMALQFAVKYKISVKAIAMAASVCALAIALAPPSLTQTSDSQKSAQNRVDMWAQGLSMLSGSPVIGVGRGQFVIHTKALIAHNSAVEITAETGLPGIFIWVSLIVTCMRSAWVRFRNSVEPRERQILAGLMMSIAGYIVSSMFVTLEFETLYMLLALCVGSGAAMKEGVYRKQEFLISCGIIVAFIVFIKVLVTLYL